MQTGCLFTFNVGALFALTQGAYVCRLLWSLLLPAWWSPSSPLPSSQTRHGGGKGGESRSDKSRQPNCHGSSAATCFSHPQRRHSQHSLNVHCVFGNSASRWSHSVCPHPTTLHASPPPGTVTVWIRRERGGERHV